jgi:uncharacterized protein (TIGR03067 family)
MKTLGLASFAAGLFIVLTAQAGDDEAQKKEKAAFAGTWKITSFENNQGKDATAEGATIEFDKEGKNLTFTKDGETKKGTFTLNPAGKPKEIDIKPDGRDKSFEGIYKIEKEKMTICLAPEPGDGRPSEFALKEGKNYLLISLEKAK